MIATEASADTPWGVQLHPAALCVFDWFLTVGDEQRHIWARKKSLVFLLFVVLRYATLGYQLTFNLAFFLPIHSNMVRT